MEKTNYAIFVDLENAGGKISTLNSIIEKVKMRGEILIGKVYGYTDQFAELKELLLSNTFSVVPSIRYGVNQKNNLDIQLVIDALDVAFTNQLIDCFCIVSGDSDYTPLVGRLKSMGKFVLGISRSEAASNIFINACNEFVFLESVASGSAKQMKAAKDENDDGSMQALNKLIAEILDEQADDDGCLYASELKNILLRLRPDFSERNYGHSSFGKLLQDLQARFGGILLINDHFAVKLRLQGEGAEGLSGPQTLSKANWQDAFMAKLRQYKEEGFERVNPSILKAAILNDYPDFDEKEIGFKKFSELLRQLERIKALKLEHKDSRTLLIRVL
ncbi:MAG: NYN domain-containing protein [Christensenellaceae bacterium]|nr:NYN domain-containing protein [Christensenellaceae bacterium]